MEEEKAAAYYNELVRKGEGAARFKQGLGFSSSSSSSSSAIPTRASALPSSSSLHTTFVKSSTPSTDFQKQANLETIQNKLRKKPPPISSSEIRRSSSSSSRVSNRERDDRDRHSRRRRSSSRDRERRRRRRSRSDSDEDRRRRRDRRRSRSRSVSPRGDRRREKSGSDRRRKDGNEKERAIDYARLIEGYEAMTPAEKVKAKMKLQLSETAEKDAANGMGPGWERFDFDKDAPLDDGEMEAAEDDVALVKHIGQSFRFSAVEAKREDQIKAAHDEAMFGAPSIPPSVTEDEVEEENDKNESKESVAPPSLISNMVISRQQGSWRDRARKA